MLEGILLVTITCLILLLLTRFLFKDVLLKDIFYILLVFVISYGWNAVVVSVQDIGFFDAKILATISFINVLYALLVLGVFYVFRALAKQGLKNAFLSFV